MLSLLPRSSAWAMEHPNFPVWRNFTTMPRSACSLISDGQTFRYKLSQDCPPLLPKDKVSITHKNLMFAPWNPPRAIPATRTLFPPPQIPWKHWQVNSCLLFFFFFLLRQTVPFGLQMNYWMLMNKMVVAGSKALRGKMVWNSTYVNLSNMIM